ncbi:MAG: ParB N-terminal domain-containing protein [Desulfamplus sp.]|nr:ParB N-terminal domain-containing protein [Desulfamplus sp.]
MISTLQTMQSCKIENIRICDIDLSDETFKISSDNDISSLTGSIKSIGMINMPMVKQVKVNQIKDKYVVISGFKRIRAIKLIGITQIQAVVIESDDKFCSCLAISDNAFQRELNIMEQVRGVRLLKHFISSDQEIIQNSLQIFNIKMNASLINMFDDIARMPESVHKLIENERLSINCAAKFKQYGYNNDLIEVFVQLFSKIKTSLSKQKEIITNIHEIAARENISISELMESEELKNILNSSENDENRKGNLLRSALFNRRYPNLSKAKEQFTEKMKDLHSQGSLRSDIKLEPPVDFEGKDYTVSFKVSNLKEFRDKIENLKAVSETHYVIFPFSIERPCSLRHNE